jgi:hypothetical protein
MRYILLATLSAAAFGQSVQSNASAVDQGQRMAAIAAKADEVLRRTTNAGREDNGSPVLLQQVTRRPVEWTLTRTVCSSLASDLRGSGQGRTTVTLVRNTDGTFNYKIADEVNGVATDGNNRRYIFAYTQNQFIDSGSGIPHPRPPYNLTGTDYFQLIPVDGGTGYTTNAFFKARINADGSLTDQGSVFSPNISCDPI